MSIYHVSTPRVKIPPRIPSYASQFPRSRCHPRFSGQRPWQESRKSTLRPLEMPIGVAVAIALFVLKYPQYLIWIYIIFFLGFPAAAPPV